MSDGISFWETERQFFEARVQPGDMAALSEAITRMTSKCMEWNRSVERLRWQIDGDEVVISFPGASSSTGWDGK